MRYANNLNHSLQVLFLKHQELLLTFGWVMFYFQIEKNPFAIQPVILLPIAKLETTEPVLPHL